MDENKQPYDRWNEATHSHKWTAGHRYNYYMVDHTSKPDGTGVDAVGSTCPDGKLGSFRSKKLAEAVAAELNQAYELGKLAGKREAIDEIASGE